MQALIKEGCILFPSKPGGRPREKKFRSELQSEFVAFPSIIDDVFTADGTNEIRELFGQEVFDFSKPSQLLERLVKQGADEEGIILDFFAGSGSMAQAVLSLNEKDRGNRRFILIQLPEPCEPESTAFKAGFKTIADICKERVRRVIKKLNDEEAGKLDLAQAKKQDRGFRVFKLAESNFTPWDAEAPKDAESLAKQLDLHIYHIRDGRTEQDILYEILLKSGFPLTIPIQTLTLEGKRVYSVADGAMLICLERELTLDLIRAMAEKKPERVVCLDEGFALPDRQAGGNDQLKANAVRIFKTKGVTSFKTV
jgi:adenine-specific DNA-methyltransferase